MANAFCNVLKGELLAGRIPLVTGHTGYKCALYTSTAALSATTTGYTATNEVAGTGYTAKGNALTIPASMPNYAGGQSVAYTDFSDTTWSTSTITARYALIYDDNATTTGGFIANDVALITLDFTSDKSSTAGDFTISFPAAATGTAIIRLA